MLYKANKHNRLYKFKVAELFDYFICACRANYWPHMGISLDEAVKKSKVAAYSSSIISRINLFAGE